MGNFFSIRGKVWFCVEEAQSRVLVYFSNRDQQPDCTSRQTQSASVGLAWVEPFDDGGGSFLVSIKHTPPYTYK